MSHLPRKIFAASLSVIMLASLTACAKDGDNKPKEPTVVTITQTQTIDPNEKPSAQRSDDVDLVVPPNVTIVQLSDQAVVSVETPDQLVHCQFNPAVDESGPFVQCEVATADYVDELKKEPNWCEGSATGQKVPGFSVSDSQVVSQCIDPLFPTPPAATVILKDGRAAQNGDLVCTSKDNQSLMTCWNTKTKHGFQITSRTYQIF